MLIQVIILHRKVDVWKQIQFKQAIVLQLGFQNLVWIGTVPRKMHFPNGNGNIALMPIWSELQWSIFISFALRQSKECLSIHLICDGFSKFGNFWPTIFNAHARNLSRFIMKTSRHRCTSFIAYVIASCWNKKIFKTRHTLAAWDFIG